MSRHCCRLGFHLVDFASAVGNIRPICRLIRLFCSLQLLLSPCAPLQTSLPQPQPQPKAQASPLGEALLISQKILLISSKPPFAWPRPRAGPLSLLQCLLESFSTLSERRPLHSLLSQ